MNVLNCFSFLFYLNLQFDKNIIADNIINQANNLEIKNN